MQQLLSPVKAVVVSLTRRIQRIGNHRCVVLNLNEHSAARLRRIKLSDLVAIHAKDFYFVRNLRRVGLDTRVEHAAECNN